MERQRRDKTQSLSGLTSIRRGAGPSRDRRGRGRRGAPFGGCEDGTGGSVCSRAGRRVLCTVYTVRCGGGGSRGALDNTRPGLARFAGCESAHGQVVVGVVVVVGGW